MERAVAADADDALDEVELVLPDVKTLVACIPRRVVLPDGIRTAQHEARRATRRRPAVRIEDQLGWESSKRESTVASKVQKGGTGPGWMGWEVGAALTCTRCMPPGAAA